MTIPEAQLDTWAKPGSGPGSRDTYATIKRALEASDAPYAGKNFSVFLQGSYGNDTNVYSESDVDLVIVLHDVYYQDLQYLPEADSGKLNAAWIAATYSYNDFKRDVTAWLKTKFGSDVDPGDKAVFIPAAGSRRNADVIIAAEFRRYYRFQSLFDQTYDEGICFWNSSSVQISNFPKQHSENCTAKHQATTGYFKPMVRILKNMRNRMVADGKLESGLAPSYYLEGLLYNVPADKFGGNYGDTFVSCYNWLYVADRASFVCANERFYLLWEGSPVTWRAKQCGQFLDAAGDYWRNW
ncbi:nucleotidyltransferase [Agrobacterium tumefaciens]|uniref:nucleotidyltransferase domain-containing protein n=1 Tax=Agrobacterium tumefaciens TaxID=358 RepID=UPI001573BAB7|nr:nucleotidyltransferase [Agrobacterium tumefaciens]NTA19307.1 nucleotidyltransferase [Agrobacterium tumefaciens]WCK74797.1 nucleotidyltransferase [Agrobacterium tumefaciens]